MAVKSAVSAHAAESQTDSYHMLAHVVPTARAYFPHYPIIKIWGMGRSPMAKKSPRPFSALSHYYNK